MAKELTVGMKAPDFSLPSSDGNIAKLSEYRGKNVVLYFYPKDMTSGCTVEARDFSDALKKFKKKNSIVFGISPDSLSRHQKFIEEESLSVPLLSDESKKVLEKYGVWKEKSMYGRKYMGVERSTFLIDADGVIQKIWRKVKVPGHVDAVLSEL